MKLLILFLALNSTAFAQGVINTQFNGVPYTCTPDVVANPNPIPVPNPAGPAACANAAYAGPFSRDQALALCAGSYSTAPADCGLMAYQGPFSLVEAIQLCTRAISKGPAVCAVAAYQGPFSKAQAITLCSSPYASAATAQCAITAYSGAYTLDQAVQLCRGQYGVVGKTSAAELPTKDALNEMLRVANEKAVHEGVYKK